MSSDIYRNPNRYFWRLLRYSDRWRLPFSNTTKGAREIAIIYSIVEAAKENRLHPYYYFPHLFKMLSNVYPTNVNALDKLMYWSTTLPITCIVFNKLSK
jgi:transposase